VIGLPLRFAIRNLLRHTRRTLIIGLGVAIGVSAAVVHRGLVAGVREQMVDQLVVSQYGHVAISPLPGETLLRDPDPIEEAVRRALPDATLAPSLSALGMAFGERAGTARIALWGIVPESEPTLMAGLRDRMAGTPAPFDAGSVYLGAALAERLEVERGDLVTLSVFGPDGSLDAMDFEVAVILKRGAPWQDYFVYLVLDDLQSLMGVGNAISLLKLHLETGTRGAAAIAERLVPVLVQTGRPARVQTYLETGQLYMGIIKASRIQARLIEIVLLVAVALSVAGAQILAVHERRREIGTMTALGTSRTLVQAVFLAEGAVLALLAGAAGAIVGVVATLLLGRTGFGMNVEAFQWMVGGPRLIPRVDPIGVLWTLAELVVIVTLSGLFPAARAARVPPIEALRGGPA
jgi:putative ABC transport system permease protein